MPMVRPARFPAGNTAILLNSCSQGPRRRVEGDSVISLSFFLNLLDYLPRPIHRIVLTFGHQLRYRIYRFFDIPQRGCCIICHNRAGQVLLVRHSYIPENEWQLPGGSIDRDTTPVEAAQRELAEEVGCTLSQPRAFEFDQIREYGCRYETWMVSGMCIGDPDPDGREILEAAFFSPSDLPSNTCEITYRRIMRWRKLVQLEARNEAPMRAIPAIEDNLVGKSRRYSKDR